MSEVFRGRREISNNPPVSPERTLPRRFGLGFVELAEKEYQVVPYKKYHHQEDDVISGFKLTREGAAALNCALEMRKTGERPMINFDAAFTQRLK